MSEKNSRNVETDRLEEMMTAMATRDPLDVQREAAARRAEREKAERIAAARPDTIRSLYRTLQEEVSDEVIQDRLNSKEVGGAGESDQQRLPAQIARAQVEERDRFAVEMLEGRFGSHEVTGAIGSGYPGKAWKDHLDSLNLSIRERVSYDEESNGKKLSHDELNDKEAIANASRLFGDKYDGLRGGSVYEEIDKARRNGNWPLPELHTGDGSRPPRNFTFSDFLDACSSPRDHRNTGSTRVSGQFGGGPIPRLQTRIGGQRAGTTPQSFASAGIHRGSAMQGIIQDSRHQQGLRSSPLGISARPIDVGGPLARAYGPTQPAGVSGNQYGRISPPPPEPQPKKSWLGRMLNSIAGKIRDRQRGGSVRPTTNPVSKAVAIENLDSRRSVLPPQYSQHGSVANLSVGPLRGSVGRGVVPSRSRADMVANRDKDSRQPYSISR